MTSWIGIFNSALLILVLGGVIHDAQRLGAMETKIDAMWEWWIRNGKER